MAQDMELDTKDWAILALLQKDASLSVQAIADKVGLSTNPCWRRIKLMEEAGIIKRRVALVDASKLGFTTTVFVSIRTRRHDAEWLAAFDNAIAGIEEITECHRMAGDIDYMLKLCVRDIADYDRIYQRLIKRVPDLADVTASFSMEEMKSTTAFPRPA
ncbi:Lrp/AsnC family transcriptional regulator [Altererythrobacter ishigakiensis]|uniref:Lrp/AsnC family transcriptional regulator n=1 Tax=Altererythrobacter ishigakiensis TaxID=476157 RepID=A0A562UTK7_9SPHN|nr:Lrp/AsnC family transcriptional regulator [Altererythrobacter ishigakiensis]TWJ08950.1 Lrp/AsnC family transcriptional regulator [Altererythrobacter ishigakiensis]